MKRINKWLKSEQSFDFEWTYVKTMSGAGPIRYADLVGHCEKNNNHTDFIIRMKLPLGYIN